jgi:hypothetical protein
MASEQTNRRLSRRERNALRIMAQFFLESSVQQLRYLRRPREPFDNPDAPHTIATAAISRRTIFLVIFLFLFFGRLG